MVAEGRGEVARFLAARPPFERLDPDELGEMVAQTELEFFPAGATILSEDGGPVTFLRVIHSGAVDITHDEQLLDLLGPGDTFGHAAMLSGLPPGFEARAAEDALIYRVPVAAARPLLERASSRELEVGATPPGHEPVARLIRSPTVRCQQQETVQEVARRMTDTGATAAIVDLGRDAMGIVTDRDLRTKVVAGGLSLDTPVSEVMTTPVFAVTPDQRGAEVLFEMLERGIRHAPVVTDRGELIGVVEDDDLYAVQPRSWFGARRSIARAKTIEELADAAGRVPEILASLRAADLRATEVVRTLSALTDAITIRVLELTSQDVELPADGLVWVAVGSQARREMTPGTIPEGAFVASEPPPEAWLSALAAGLESCGLPHRVIARTPVEWKAFNENEELSLTVLVERRALWGTPREPLPSADERDRDRLLSALARRALAYSPPTGFDPGAVLEADGSRSTSLDIRHAAVIPIVELGRWAGAAAGVIGGSTPERLRAAVPAGVLEREEAETLADAFDLALELRIAHHLEQLAAGSHPDDAIDPEAISPLTRDYLRDVFRAVSAVQRRLRE
ncbi:MAG TPA: putative nucleotidyltransferase substrate binding domain-containing protein [Solirubrobacteraceae bacterium]|nr:putative nucleotidyltransferase substrate binding domain-containing protein [Solirubrobacteraceae bacterium]